MNLEISFSISINVFEKLPKKGSKSKPNNATSGC